MAHPPPFHTVASALRLESIRSDGDGRIAGIKALYERRSFSWEVPTEEKPQADAPSLFGIAKASGTPLSRPRIRQQQQVVL